MFNLEILNDPQIIKKLNIERYAYIISYLPKTDVTKNPDFQRVYNSFFRVRRNEQWRNIYGIFAVRAR